MGLSCSEHLLRILFFVFNFAFWGAGVILIGAGIWCIFSVNEYEKFGTDYVTNISGVFIALGAVILIIGFLGCCGSVKQNHIMVYIYAILIIVLFALQVGGAITAFIYQDNSKEYVLKGMIKSQESYLLEGELAPGVKKGDMATKKVWDRLQRDFECCGSSGPSSWSERFGENNATDSCCVKEIDGCGTNFVAGANTVYSAGCLDKVLDVVTSDLLVMGLIAIIFALLQWFGVLIACCLGSAFSKAGYGTID